MGKSALFALLDLKGKKVEIYRGATSVLTLQIRYFKRQKLVMVIFSDELQGLTQDQILNAIRDAAAPEDLTVEIGEAAAE